MSHIPYVATLAKIADENRQRFRIGISPLESNDLTWESPKVIDNQLSRHIKYVEDLMRTIQRTKSSYMLFAKMKEMSKPDTLDYDQGEKKFRFKRKSFGRSFQEQERLIGAEIQIIVEYFIKNVSGKEERKSTAQNLFGIFNLIGFISGSLNNVWTAVIESFPAMLEYLPALLAEQILLNNIHVARMKFDSTQYDGKILPTFTKKYIADVLKNVTLQSEKIKGITVTVQDGHAKHGKAPVQSSIALMSTCPSPAASNSTIQQSESTYPSFSTEPIPSSSPVESLVVKKLTYNLDTLLHTIKDAPGRLLEYSNNLDFTKSMHELYNLGFLKKISQASLELKSESLSFGTYCFLSRDYTYSAGIHASLKNIFILLSKRLEILEEIIEIDFKIHRIKVNKERDISRYERMDKLIAAKENDIFYDTFTSWQILLSHGQMDVVTNLLRLSMVYSGLMLHDISSHAGSIGKENLISNGFNLFDAQKTYVNILKVNEDMHKKFDTAKLCTTSEMASQAFYTYEITTLTNPELFRVRTTYEEPTKNLINLSIAKDCPVYADRIKPALGQKMDFYVGSCDSNTNKYNLRMEELAIEFLSGTKSLNHNKLSSRPIEVQITQLGNQTFRASDEVIKLYKFAQSSFQNVYLHLGNDEIDNNPIYSKISKRDGLRDSNFELDAVCPSPFSSYQVDIKINNRVQKMFFQNLTSVRVHAKVSYYSKQDTALKCFNSRYD